MINVKITSKKPYALDGLWPIRHIVTTLVRAEKALTISEFKYQHALAGDISRVKFHETGKNSSDREANEWLIGWGLTELGPDQIEEIDGTFKLKIPHEQVAWCGRKIFLIEDDVSVWPGGSEPFSELNGTFHANIREKEADDLTELRDSMREHGWVEEFPALKDERGVVLVGHRRLKVAKELGIDPKTVTIEIGRGPQADARRLRIAIVSNLGFRPMSKKSRERLSRYLYDDLDWAIEKVAAALKVSLTTISTDLANAGIITNNGNRTDTLGRARGGRLPKGSTKLPGGISPEQKEEIIHLHFELDKSRRSVQKEMGISKYVVDKVIDAEMVLRESHEPRKRAIYEEPTVVEEVQKPSAEVEEVQEKSEVVEPTIVHEPDASENTTQTPPVEEVESSSVAPDHVCVCSVCGAQMHLQSHN